jgi:hypothetical protein
VSLKEEKLGKWYNFETGEYGDMLGKKFTVLDRIE